MNILKDLFSFHKFGMPCSIKWRMYHAICFFLGGLITLFTAPFGYASSSTLNASQRIAYMRMKLREKEEKKRF